MRVQATAIAVLIAAIGCGGGGGAAPTSTRPESIQRGKASWYGGKFHGRKTASGERFDKRALTGAHRTLPFGTVVRVTNEINGNSVTLTINDRGPWGGRGRIIDVSEAAAKKLQMVKRGVVPVTVEVLRRPDRARRSKRR